MYFHFIRVCEFRVTLSATEWVVHFSANFHVSSVQQGLQIVLLSATEWVFHYGAGFHVSSLQQGLQNLSLIESN